MALVLDTGPIFGSLDRTDQDHDACRMLLESATEQLVIPAPVLAEVDYWVDKWLDPRLTVALIDDVISGFYRVEELQPVDYVRSARSATSTRTRV
jgi:predicted nucleic acid-binding protein